MTENRLEESGHSATNTNEESLWNSVFNQKEVVLLYQLKLTTSPTLANLPEIITVTHPDSNQKYDYIDCSGVTFCSKQNSSQSFHHVFFLSRWLSKVAYVKVLLVLDFDDVAKDVEKFYQLLKVCPFTQLFCMEHLDKNSIGVIVVHNVKKNEQIPTVNDLRKSFDTYLRQAKIKPVAETKTSVGKDGHFGQIHFETFIDALRETKNFLVLTQQYRNWSIQKLVALPSPPGYKIIKFCYNIQTFSSTALKNSHIWEVYRICSPVHYFYKHADDWNWFLEREISSLLNSAISAIIICLKRQSSAHSQSESDTFYWVEIVQKCLSAASPNAIAMRHQDAVEILKHLSTLVGCQIDQDTVQKLELKQEQRSLLLEMCTANGMDLDIHVNPKLIPVPFEFFLDDIKQNVVPDFRRSLNQKQKVICQKLQSSYKEIVGHLITMFGRKFIEQFIRNRKTGIKTLAESEILTKVLRRKGNARKESERIREIYNVLGCPEQSMTEKFIQSRDLAEKHDQIGQAMVQIEGTSECKKGHHFTFNQISRLANQITKSKKILQSCDEQISAITQTVRSLASQMEYQLGINMTRENLKEKLDLVLKVLEKMSKCTALDAGVECLEIMLSNEPNAPVMANMRALVSDLEKQTIVKSLKISSDKTFGWFFPILEAATKWETSLRLAMKLDERLQTYEGQRKCLQNKDCLSQTLLALFLVLEDDENDCSHVDSLLSLCSTNTHWSKLLSSITLSNLSTKYESEGGRIIVKGKYVLLSDVSEKLRQNAGNEIRIYASEKVFLDVDLIENSQELIIIAKTIEVIEKRKIKLNGIKGSDYLFRAQNGHPDDLNGRHGEPGKPGSNGGHFYLLCDSEIGLERLTVDCSGGDGGQGENGGHGYQGKNGRDANAKDLANGINYHEGFPGSAGGNGGDGGRGGSPGFRGTATIEVFSSLEQVNARLIVNDGQWGGDGNGGRGGEGGYSGLGCTQEKILWLFPQFVMDAEDKRVKADAGRAGRKGWNTTGQIHQSRPSKTVDISEAVLSYRKFLIKTGEPLSVGNKNFLIKLDHKVEDSRTSASTLVEELLLLTKCQHSLRAESYLNFQTKVRGYVQRQQSRLRTQSQASPLFDLLDAFSISKVLLLQDNRRYGTHVVNLIGYFDVLTDTITKLKSEEVNIFRANTLQEFQSHISKKREDLRAYLTQIVAPAVNEAQEEMRKHFQKAVVEMEGYKDLLEDQKRQQVQNSETTKIIQKFKPVFSILKVVESLTEIAQFAGFLGAGFISQAIFYGTRAIKRKATEFMPKELAPIEPVLLPACLQTQDFWQMMNDKVGKMMLTQIKSICAFLEKCKDANVKAALYEPLCLWVELFDNFKIELKSAQITSAHEIILGKAFADVEQARDDVLQKIWDTSTNQNTPCEVTNALRLLYINLLLGNSVDNGGQSLSHYKKMDFVGLRDPLNLKQARIEAHQDSIYHQMIPLVNGIVECLTSSSEDPGNAHLKKWKIHSVLQQLKHKVIDAVGGLQSEPKILDCLERIRDGIILLIDFHNDINQLYEKSELMETFFKISSSSVPGSSVAGVDPHVREQLVQLQYDLKVNIFQLEYEQALKAFHQWIFPFAKKFPLENGHRKDAQINEYIDKFEAIRSVLLHYKNLTMDCDSVIFTGEFAGPSKNSSCPSFYIWTEDDPITRLLNGYQTVFKADVCSAAKLDFDRRAAIKFKAIRLKFIHKSGRERDQEELDKILTEQYNVTMIHSGISYYRVFDQVFVMRGNQQEFTYSFDNKSMNMTLEKSRRGNDYLLSPYTMWTFQLRDIASEREINNSLKSFEGKVALHLEGEGWFVDEKISKEKQLDKSYFKDLSDCYEIIQ